MFLWRAPVQGRHPVGVLWGLCLWLATVGNLPLWWRLGHLPEVSGVRGWGVGLVLVCLVALLLQVFLSLWVWPRWLKPAATLLLLVSASSSYFMVQYGIVIDSSMLANVAATDVREVRDLLSPGLVGALLLVGVLPAWWLWRQPVRPLPWRQVVLRQGLGALGALLLALALGWLVFQDLASLMRNHKPLRYMVNPLNSLYATAQLIGPAKAHAGPLQPVGVDAHLRHPAATPGQAPLLVLVLGETARAANFGLGGYARDTTPRLHQLQSESGFTYFSNVRSCGTSTQASVPCMFSHLGKRAFESDPGRHENLLDVLHHAGLAVLWLDNQSGCKGLCDRVPTVSTTGMNCAQGECHDDIMLKTLPLAWDKLPADRKARGTVVVMHQMGSHGPAYYKRTPAEHKVFLPECTTNVLADCDPQALINTYDNTLVYTDYLLAQTIAWLKQQQRPTALLYVSDHGESLGENGLYLHGMPYSLAPDVQTQVPMLTWLSAAWQAAWPVQAPCVKTKASQALTHDHLFHSVLGLMGVNTQVYQPTLDITAGCVR
jgi:lipid A ethanolaminephosphotransferase